MEKRQLINPLHPDLPVWRLTTQAPVSCTEKIRVLNDNFLELKQVLKDMIEDALLMGCDEAGLRQELARLVLDLPVDVVAVAADEPAASA